jgi:hypothetical protein
LLNGWATPPNSLLLLSAKAWVGALDLRFKQRCVKAGTDPEPLGLGNEPIGRLMHSHSLTCRIGSIIGQRTRKRHEDDQSDNRDDDYHDDYLWVAEALARDHKCSGDIALTSAKGHDALGVNVRSAK